MQSCMFTGRLAKPVRLVGADDKPVGKFTLIANEYAGREHDARKVALDFTVFGGQARTMAEHAETGQQILVRFRIENNDYDKDGQKVYGHNFVVDEFEFGARPRPGDAEQ